ncbi:hypothetical protein BDP27DRAFT_1419089 [Rhodocollybia butyracea]|uniref:Uncharacterized protein n=1 Tax=Rhodocollybia butyracea TaxID=206335 RepID=A0A9P5Q0A9_9AGAR|nr:hypothetical protein BDP27DRAFT_1419089 [Rhodocollybia butyracea]
MYKADREQLEDATRRRDSPAPSTKVQVKALLDTIKGRPDVMLVITSLENIDFSHELLDHALTSLTDSTNYPFLVSIDGPNLTVSSAELAIVQVLSAEGSYPILRCRVDISSPSALLGGSSAVLCRPFSVSISPSSSIPSSEGIGLAFASFAADGLEYIDRIVPNHPDKALFRARITSNGNTHSETSVVKFTHTGIAPTHTISSRRSNRPKHRSSSSATSFLRSGFYVVVMGYVPHER